MLSNVVWNEVAIVGQKTLLSFQLNNLSSEADIFLDRTQRDFKYGIQKKTTKRVFSVMGLQGIAVKNEGRILVMAYLKRYCFIILLLVKLYNGDFVLLKLLLQSFAEQILI